MFRYINTLLYCFLIIPLFGQETHTTGPKNGTLLIMGGAAADHVFVPIFEDLIGSKTQPIVLIPTAGSDRAIGNDPEFNRYKRMFEKFGFTNITVLHTRDRKVANSSTFVKAIDQAKGVWIFGGRQWRLAEAYLGTTTEKALHRLLKRGGVVAGSSAGATIQGSYLIRGDKETNTIFIGKHKQGFGFLKNAAIDQHLLARNRHFDMFELLNKKPELLGIGIDENTGIIVRGSTFEVVGESYVAIYDGTRWSDEKDIIYELKPSQKQFYFLKKGQQYDLVSRTVLKE